MAIYWMGAFEFCNRNDFVQSYVFKSDVCAYLKINSQQIIGSEYGV